MGPFNNRGFFKRECPFFFQISGAVPAIPANQQGRFRPRRPSYPTRTAAAGSLGSCRSPTALLPRFEVEARGERERASTRCWEGREAGERGGDGESKGCRVGSGGARPGRAPCGWRCSGGGRSEDLGAAEGDDGAGVPVRQEPGEVHRPVLEQQERGLAEDGPTGVLNIEGVRVDGAGALRAGADVAGSDPEER